MDLKFYLLIPASITSDRKQKKNYFHKLSTLGVLAQQGADGNTCFGWLVSRTQCRMRINYDLWSLIRQSFLLLINCLCMRCDFHSSINECNETLPFSASKKDEKPCSTLNISHHRLLKQKMKKEVEISENYEFRHQNNLIRLNLTLRSERNIIASSALWPFPRNKHWNIAMRHSYNHVTLSRCK